MIPTILLAAVCTLPQELVVRDECAIVEVNHYYDADGKKVFSQLLFWDADFEHCQFVVVDWKLHKRPTQTPRRDYRRNVCAVSWLDGNVFRRVTAPDYRETWTQYDPELENREVLEVSQRRRLRRLRITP